MYTTDKMQAIFAGFFLLCLTVSVSATCQDVADCFSNLGSTIPTNGQDYSTIINFLCQDKNKFLRCLSKFDGCETYKTYVSFYQSEDEDANRMDVLCSHRSEYINAIKCVIDAMKSMSQADLVKSMECTTQLSKPAMQNPGSLQNKCTSLNQLINCSPLDKATMTCTANLMVLMSESNSQSIQCLDVYKSLSSGSRRSAYSVILPVGWLIAFILKGF